MLHLVRLVKGENKQSNLYLLHRLSIWHFSLRLHSHHGRIFQMLNEFRIHIYLHPSCGNCRNVYIHHCLYRLPFYNSPFRYHHHRHHRNYECMLLWHLAG